MDAWTIQELIVERDVDLVIECGTYEGGLTLFMASLFDLLERGQIITVDVDDYMTDSHPRIERIMGSSTDPEIVATVSARVADINHRELLIILDSDHSTGHVLDELEAYSCLGQVGGYIVVQDGVVDELPRFRDQRPGPLVAIRKFVARDDRFVIDRERSAKFVFHYSPEGCLRRVR
jgi:cephalosporin hydroxylase